MVSYEVLMSFIVRLFHVNTAFFMHTILPVFLIPVHYIVIYQIGKFISQRYAYHFVLLYSVFNLFSAYSGYSQGAFLLYRIWQGKSGVINIIVPILILTFLYICDKKDITVTDIGIAMGNLGSEAAIEAADVILVKDDLHGIVALMKIAKETLRSVSQNITFAVFIKILVLFMAVIGYFGMWEAILVEMVVVILAVINSAGVAGYTA